MLKLIVAILNDLFIYLTERIVLFAMHCFLFIELTFDSILVSDTVKFITRNGGHVLVHFQIPIGYGPSEREV